MRSIALCLLSVAVTACGSDDEAPLGTVQQAPAEVIEAPDPEHGGTVVMAGQYPVEVIPHASGQVYAHVLGDAPAPSDVELTVSVPLEGRTTGRPVRLRWDARDGRYEGRVRRLEIVPGPVDVVIVVGGVEYLGHVDVIVVLPAIEVHVVEARGKHKHKHKHHKHHGGHVIVVH